MWVIKNKKIFFSLSGILIGLSFLAIAVFGIEWGLDFTGGSIIEVEYEENRPTVGQIEEALTPLEFSGASIQPTGELGVILRLPDITPEQKNSLDEALSIEEEFSFEQERFSSVGPTLGAELYKKGLWAIGLVIVIIILFIAFTFSGVSKPVSSWKYGIATIIALAHDITIPLGLMAVLGQFYGLQVDALFLTALLAILGLSVNDTIVVFDRVRENLNNQENKNQPFEEVVGESLSQTYTRSINTSLTTLIVLLALFFLGGETTKAFAGILALGMVVGTYSSIFLASPLLTIFKQNNSKKA